MTPKQQAVEDMIDIGRRMANVCYGLRQAPEQQVGKHNADVMDSLFRQWDSAVRQYRKLTKKARA